MSPLLAAVSGLLAFAAAWEVAGLGWSRPRFGLAARIAARFGLRADGGLAGRLGLADRLRRAGLEGRLGPRVFLAAKACSTATGCVGAVAVLPVAPGRLAPFVVAAMLAGGFMAPDAWLERAARRRAARISAALPDVLDLLAVGAGTGREPTVMLAEIGAASRGPLAAELAIAAAAIESGASRSAALRSMGEHTGVPELGALAATLERSRRFGSPLAEQLHARAGALRLDERRRIAERAAQAAPKIQLVVALMLVPAALLAIAASLVAHAGTLLGAVRA